MNQYVSTRGGIAPVGFAEAVLKGFAEDGGLFVPTAIPRISEEQLEAWAALSYPDLAFEILSLFIDSEVIPAEDLKGLIQASFQDFDHPEILPLVPLQGEGGVSVMELFHGPTLSFKDIAMGFLINTMDYLLTRRGGHLNLILATTGDTGPAAAYASAGKTSLDCWPLYPEGLITEEQKRQMTTLSAENVHPVGVTDCPDGGDDLDLIVAGLFSDAARVRDLGLSSVNSINWCRVLMQSVQYVYGYCRVCRRLGEPLIFSVPSGAFGNLFAGFLAREMGVPIATFICANNRNSALHTAFSTGVFKKQDLIPTVSSAIDIVVPYNFWRFLYYQAGADPEKLAAWMDRFHTEGEVRLDLETASALQSGYASCSVSDAETLSTIRGVWESSGYLLDPHGAVAVAAARELRNQLHKEAPLLCMTTAHPGKFPEVIARALGDGGLPPQALHPALQAAAQRPEKGEVCSLNALESRLIAGLKAAAVHRR